MSALSVVMMLTCCDSRKEPANPMEAMCQRLFPDHADSFEFYQLDDTTGVDCYTLESDGGKICIGGNNYNSMAVALNRYLRDYCNTYVSWYAADAIEMPEKLPSVPEKVSGKANTDTRFFLNYCTSGYTMPYWKWSDWERLIDWMALNGVNMPLATHGQEAVWMRVWKQLGLDEEQIQAYFTGPAHLPWHRMINIDSWQGPLPMSYIESQEELQKKILERERELNMTPVLPAFAGHVPAAMKEVYPEAEIHAMSRWGGFNPDWCGTHFIEPTDSLFDVIQRMYIDEQAKTFGTDHIYGVDPFNELDVPEWSEEYLSKTAKKIYNSLAQADPDARWLQMTWMFYYSRSNWTDPLIKAFLTAIPEDRMILLDYFCDKVELWKETERFHGNPYIWCYLGNFGGNTMIIGDLNTVASRIDSTLVNGGDNLAGFGGTLEALDVNPHMYEYVLDRAWGHSGKSTAPSDWIAMWAKMRGGDKDVRIVNAWQRLNDEIYTRYCGGNYGLLINARPQLEGIEGWCVTPYYNYDNDSLMAIWGELLDSDADNTAHRFDVVNVGRQAIGNMFLDMRARFNEFYKQGDIEAMKGQAAAMDTLILDCDRLLSTEPTFSIGQWIADARAIGADDAEKDYYEENARCIVTTWGAKATQLNDYANRSWGGLTRSFYRERWKQFTDAVIAAAEKGEQFDQAAFRARLTDWEEEWTRQREEFPISSGEKAVDVARELYAKYGPAK